MRIGNPSVKLNKQLKDFYNRLIERLNKNECENIFEYLVNDILNENKCQSNYGHKIVAQMLIRKYNDLPIRNLSKVLFLKLRIK